jgi:hypothetical protein
MEDEKLTAEMMRQFSFDPNQDQAMAIDNQSGEQADGQIQD